VKDSSPAKIHLSDYTPPAYLVDSVHLTFRLSPDATRVISRITFVPNPATQSRHFQLDGENINLIWARIDDQPVTPDLHHPRRAVCLGIRGRDRACVEHRP
jgi:aminopeptidase N